MSAQHTPGPWRFSTHPHDGNYMRIHCSSDPHEGDNLRGYCGEANARLIAAAPEMLAALQAVLAEIDGPDRPHSTDSCLPAHLAHQVRAAIAKAEGGAA